MAEVILLRQDTGADAHIPGMSLKARKEFSEQEPGIASMGKDIIPSIGHSVLDEEHKHLLGFAMFCILTCPHLESRHDCNGCTTGTPEQCRGGLSNVLNHLLPYLQKHFADEENVMQQVCLDKKDPLHMAIHFGAHNYLLQQVRTIAAELDTNPTGSATVSKAKQLHDLLMEELLDHLHRADKKLIPYLRSNGIDNRTHPPHSMNIVNKWFNKFGFTQEQGAEILGVDKHTLARWEHKENSDLPPDIFHMLCMLVGGKYYDYCHDDGIDSGE